MMAASGATLYTAWIDIGLKGLDKVQSYMQSAVNVVQASTTQISSMFSRSESAIHSFIGAANPMAMNTFGASVEILKARIGQNFTPYVLQAAKAVQDLSRWIKEMNPETKKAIANWVMYGVAAAGAFYALNQILAVSRAIVANPLALAILGIAAAAVKAGADMDKMIKSMDAAIERGERMKKGIFTEREYNGSTAEAIVNDSSMTKDEKIAKAKELKAKMIAESHQLAADNKNDTFGKQASTTFQWAKGQLGFEDSTANDAKKMEELNNEIGLLTNAIDKMAADKPIEFKGTINEDLTSSVTEGQRGQIILTSLMNSVVQKETQTNAGGLTEIYLELGTYTKSFYSVMAAPSCVKIASMGDTHLRIHHEVHWKNAVPKIIRED